ncbi:MAG: PKD domain-containing protein, partial [Planctomycetaceae bacterium]|nr:PKD domain-containing protein [Planctomycetaceae bacterium]
MVESVEARVLLAAEFSVFGGNPNVQFDPNADVFLRYDRESDTLNLRVRNTVDLNDLQLEVDTQGFAGNTSPGFVFGLAFPGFDTQPTFADTTVRLTGDIELRRGEFLGSNLEFADFQVTDFLFRIALRAEDQTLPDSLRNFSKQERIAESEGLMQKVRLKLGAETRELQFYDLNAPASNLIGPETGTGLLDQELTFSAELFNLPPVDHKVTITIEGEGSPIVQEFDFPADGKRNRSVEVSQAFSTTGTKTVRVATLADGIDVPNVADFILVDIVEPNSTGGIPGDPLVGANGLLRIDPFDIVVKGGFNATQSEAHIDVGVLTGTVHPSVHGDVFVRITGEFFVDSSLFEQLGAQPTGEFLADPFQLFTLAAVPDEVDGSIPAVGRTFQTTGLLDSVGLNTPSLRKLDEPNVSFFEGTRLSDRSLKFELIDTAGNVLDTVPLDQSQLRSMRSDRGNEGPDDFGQIRPLDVDVSFSGNGLVLGNGSVSVRAHIFNLLPQLAGVAGDVNVRFDFGDGTTPVVQPLLQTDIRFNTAVQRAQGDRESTDLVNFDVPVTHTYETAGEFDVVVTVTLPNGRASVTTHAVKIESQPLLVVDFFVNSVNHETTNLLGIEGRIQNLGNSLSFPVTVDIGGLTRESTIDVLANGTFDQSLLFPQGVFDLIPNGETSVVVDGVMTIESVDHRTILKPFQVELFASEASFNEFREGQDRFLFQGFGDFFEVDVPLLADTQSQSNVPVTGTVTFTGTLTQSIGIINTFIATARQSVGQVNGEAIGSVELDPARDFVVRSFFDNPGGGRTLRDTTSFPVTDATNPAPRVVIAAPNPVNESANFRPVVTLSNLSGNVTIEVEYEDGLIQTLNQNIPSNDPVAIANLPTRIFEQTPGGAETGTANFTVRVIRGGNVDATATSRVEIRDVASPFDQGTMFVARSNPASGQFDVELQVRANDLNANEELRARVTWLDGLTEFVDLVRNPAEGNVAVAILNHTYSLEFLNTFANTQGQDGDSINVTPRITLLDDSGREASIFVFDVPEFRTIGIQVTEDPSLLTARVESGNGLAMGDRRVVAGEAFEASIITGDLTNTIIRNHFLGLQDQEELRVFIDLNQDDVGGGARNGPFITLVKTGEG